MLPIAYTCSHTYITLLYVFHLQRLINMIKIIDIMLAFNGKTLFENVNFYINTKEKIALTGRNGSGKSSFIKLIEGKLEPDHGRIDIPSSYTLGFLQQHIVFKYDSVIDEMASVLPEDRIYEMWKAEKILEGLGFSEDDMLTDQKQFSGGYQIKINLAKLLLQEPDMLLLDEPTNYLDIHSTNWLKKFLQKWPSELLLITHDRAFADSIITHTINIHRGIFRKIQGNTQKVTGQIALEEHIHEKTRENTEKKRLETQAWIDKYKAKASMATRVQSKVKALEREHIQEKLGEIKTLSFAFNHAPYTSKEPLLKVENLTFGYTDDMLLIRNLSFYIKPGDKICVIGKNGKGKSTLLKLLSHNIQQQYQGNITYHNTVKTGYFGQMNIDRLHSNNTICDEIQNTYQGASETLVRKVAARMLFSGDDAKKKIAVLSGGEKSRVMLGKILIKPANLLFLDEPTNHLDMESADALMVAIQQFTGAVVIVTHDEMYLNNIANKLIIFDTDRVFLFENSYAHFLQTIGWKDT